MTDERFDDGLKRLQNYDDLIPILEKVFLADAAHTWLKKLEAEGVPCATVNRLEDALHAYERLVQDYQKIALQNYHN